ncbi:conjugal transfer protein [Stygiolobus sp. CP850M]|uniref:conjugal transfer protein n=1 Tax=Stygiolobus sp. CP850M TaxID=3133134 RepID=UPI00307ED609
MDWELSLFNIAIVIVFYESFHAYLYYKSKGVRREGKVNVRVLDINEENAITLNSIFFRNTIVFLSNKISEEVLRHEEGHTKQFNYIYVFLVAIAALLPVSTLLAIPAVLLGKFLLWKMERDADLYAYIKYNVKYESGAERPKRKLDRIKAWIFDSHPPDWVREKEEYYQKKNSLIKLFLEDLLS